MDWEDGGAVALLAVVLGCRQVGMGKEEGRGECCGEEMG